MKQTIGCSELGDVFNLDYGCSRRLFYKKHELPEDRPQLDDRLEKAKLRGIKLEDLAIETLEAKRKITTRRLRVKLTSKDCPLVGYVDRVCDDKVIEAKCPSLFMYNKMKREGISDSYILQMNGYLYLRPAPSGMWAIFHPDPMDVLDPDVERNDKLINKIVDGVNEFWKKVEAKTEPDRLELGDFRCRNCQYIDTCWGDKAATIDNFSTKAVDLEDMSGNSDLLMALDNYNEARKNIEQYVDVLESSEEEIKRILGEKEKVLCGESRIYYTTRKQVRWDLKKLSAEKPELKEKYQKETLLRSFRVY